MILLITFAFIGGIVTILSPCVLPILPIVLSGSISGGKNRPFGVILGFILSFTFFTLTLTAIVRALHIPAENLRLFSVVVILFFGLSLILPQFQKIMEKAFTSLARFSPHPKQNGLWGGILIGLSIGLIWTPCVGPILASVISLALTGTVTGSAFLITLAYASGTAIPMLAITWGGRNLLNKNPWLTANSGKIQKAFGVVMIITAVGIYFNIDRKFQTFILDAFPRYGAGLTSLEDNPAVQEKLQELSAPAAQNKRGPKAPEIISGGVWFNLPSDKSELTLSELRGKVVLIDFWTYSCINCIRTLPYLRKWHETYADKGFVIIGVHTPEFEFEKDPENVSQAISDFELTYPIVQDNNYATWQAYNNRYWPAKYLIDKDGYIRYTHFGEGNYDETESQIQKLLEEAGAQTGEKVENPDYQISAKTPETYLGYSRMQFYARPKDILPEQKKAYELPRPLGLHSFGFEGDWIVQAERSQAFTNSALVLNFEAKNVFLVANPKNGQSGKIQVLLDGQQIKTLIIDKDKLYEVVNLDEGGKHELRLEFLDNNLEVYAFTFG